MDVTDTSDADANPGTAKAVLPMVRTLRSAIMEANRQPVWIPSRSGRYVYPEQW